MIHMGEGTPSEEGFSLPHTPTLPKTFDWWGGSAAGVPLCGKASSLIFLNPFTSFGRTQGEHLQIGIFPVQG